MRRSVLPAIYLPFQPPLTEPLSLVLPFLGVLAYLISQAGSIAECNSQQAQQARDELRRVVGFSVADEFRNLIS
jgi:hypothetical protein